MKFIQCMIKKVFILWYLKKFPSIISIIDTNYMFHIFSSINIRDIFQNIIQNLKQKLEGILSTNKNLIITYAFHYLGNLHQLLHKFKTVKKIFWKCWKKCFFLFCFELIQLLMQNESRKRGVSIFKENYRIFEGKHFAP